MNRPLLALLALACACPAGEANRMLVWNGEEAKSGQGWAGPETAKAGIAPRLGTAVSGQTALAFTGSGAEWIGAIWNWRGWFPKGSGDDVSQFRNLSFRIKVACEGELGSLTVSLASQDGKTAAAKVIDYCPELLDGNWHEVVIPFADLAPEEKYDPHRVWQLAIDSWAPAARTFTVLLDDLGFDDRMVRPLSVWVREPEARAARPLAEPAAAVTAEVAAGEGQPVSPWIYGVAMAEPKLCAELGVPIRRAGGNPLSPVSWRLGFGSKGADWFFQNDGRQVPPEQNWIVAFHRANKAAGLESYLSIPLMGRVAKDGSSVAFDTGKYPGQESWAGKVQPKDRLPNAGNGRRQAKAADGSPLLKDGKPVWEEIEPDPDDTSLPMSVAEQCAILPFMVREMGYGTADAGGIRFLALDNEPCLWASTHRGMRPRGYTYEELWETTLQASRLLKQADPKLLIAGPTSWGWTAYFCSARDAQLCGRGEASWQAPPEYVAHGNTPFGKWYLQQNAARLKADGVLPVDILDWHFYPQNGIYMGGKPHDPEWMERRAQETRVLWDPAFVDPTWMGRGTIEVPHLVGGKPGVIALIRLMHAWLNAAGLAGRMQLSLGEYNFGGEGDVSGGVAQAEIFGIFARERLDHAYLWFAPPPNSSQYFAWKLLRNVDGKGLAVGDRYLPASVSAPDDVSVHAYRDAKTGRLSLLLVNKRAARPARVTVKLPAALPAQSVEAWEYAAVDMRCIGRLPARQVAGASLVVDLHPMSVQRLDLKP